MKLADCIEKIERYLNSDYYSPRFVNVNNSEDLRAIEEHFRVGKNEFISISRFADKDENPKQDDLQRAISVARDDLFVVGLTSFLKLLGESELLKGLGNFTTETYSAHVIILCYQCAEYLNFSDIRANRLVYDVDGRRTKLPDIVLLSPKLPIILGIEPINGVEEIPYAIEHNDNKKIYVKTKKRKSSYPDSLLFLSEISEPFEVLVNIDNSTSVLKSSYGTDEQWAYAVHEVSKCGSWDSLITDQFGVPSNLSLVVSSWSSLNEDKKWLYFIALKIKGAGNNWCLNTAVNNAGTVDELIRQVYRSILHIPHLDATFWDKYDERKVLINSIGGVDNEVIDYLLIVKSKASEEIYYLTDRSMMEKERIIELIDTYASKYTREKLEKLLSHIYPDLYDYLQPYNFRNDVMNKYFQDYKYQKLINIISPDFLELVAEQAKKRDFNLWLAPRSEKIESLNKENSKLYFVDAMGVEYMGFILAQCKNMNLMANALICRCELPSITKFNKEFLDAFDNIAPDVKRLDDIKHHGAESFDYRQTKLPFHLIRELEIIRDVMKNIRDRLANGSIERAYIISDHGSSRLTVIHESENQWNMASKGEHSGRCCPISEVDVQSEYATESNGFWVLANYDRFKGGRKASVEVHGGATLEEVTVPIIELTYASKNIEVSIRSVMPIKISFRKKAELQLFSKTKLGDVTICISGGKIDKKYYEAVPLGNNLYLVKMPDIKDAGDYSMIVFSDNNQLVQLSFSVVKEGSMERDLL